MDSFKLEPCLPGGDIHYPHEPVDKDKYNDRVYPVRMQEYGSLIGRGCQTLYLEECEALIYNLEKKIWETGRLIGLTEVSVPNGVTCRCLSKNIEFVLGKIGDNKPSPLAYFVWPWETEVYYPTGMRTVSEDYMIRFTPNSKFMMLSGTSMIFNGENTRLSIGDKMYVTIDFVYEDIQFS
jgi:hypothetical protein